MEDYKFSAYITNLDAYNEGDLVGEWLEFPTSIEEFQEVLDAIGADEDSWFVSDYDCTLYGFTGDELGEPPSYDELQEFAERLGDIEFRNVYEYTGDVDEAIHGIDNGDIYFYPRIYTDKELGEYYVEELFGGVDQLGADTIEMYFDYEQLGRELDYDEYETENDEGEYVMVSAGEYFCGDENASHTEIGEAFVSDLGIDSVSNPEYYFDYDAYGRDIRLGGSGMFTTDGYVDAQ